MATPPPPPRTTGNAEEDVTAVFQWANAFYRAVVLEGEYAKASVVLASLPDDFDASTLTDPASATVATAQQTANDAYLRALTANQAVATLSDELDDFKALLDEGSFTISNTDTSAAITFATERANTNYEVVISAKNYTGVPDSAAFIVVSAAASTTGFTATPGAAPGAGTSVTYGWIVYEKE